LAASSSPSTYGEGVVLYRNPLAAEEPGKFMKEARIAIVKTSANLEK
jgi:hypothetical protein